MLSINLSFVITTFNKLNYLTVVLEHLMNCVSGDEEIIVVDGYSTDGTRQYLEKLFQEKKINKYLSEKDIGESHGINKAILMADGILIKTITDDDAYNYSAIEKCKEFMLNHPLIDVMGGGTGGLNIRDKNSIYLDEYYYKDFIAWRGGKLKRFFFNGTCLILRKSSLPILGLVDSNILVADMEYTLRITGVANLAWFTGVLSLRILNSQSNNLVYYDRAIEESKNLCSYYKYEYPWLRKTKYPKKKLLKMFIKSILKMFRNIFIKLDNSSDKSIESFQSFNEAHNFGLRWLNNHELNKEIKFLTKLKRKE